jgi:hypothetical protein
MLGAPFWFDLLNKFMVIRSTVKPHEKSPEEGSEDKQDPSSKPDASKGKAALGNAKAPKKEASATAAVKPPFEPHTWRSGADRGVL